MKTKILPIIALSVMSLLALAACGKSPEEQSCEFFYKDLSRVYRLERGPEAVAKHKELASNLYKIAQKAEPDIARAADELNEAIRSANKVVTDAVSDARVALRVACNSHGYDFDYFYPDAPRR